MARLQAAGGDLAVGAEDAIHAPNRAVVGAPIEQGGVDLGWRKVGEAGRTEQVEYSLARSGRQCLGSSLFLQLCLTDGAYAGPRVAGAIFRQH